MKYLFYVSLFFLSINVYSQDPNTPFSSSNTVILSHNSEIKGHEYLYDAWNQGLLVMNDSLFFMQDFLRYDAYNDRILMKQKKDSETVFEIDDIDLTGFSITDASKNKKHNYVKLQSTQFLDGETTGYFEIIDNTYNTNYFLMKTKKVIYDPNKSRGTEAQNNLQSEYRVKRAYFLKNENGLYEKVRLKKKDILALLPKHTSEIKSYISSKKISFSKVQQVSQLVNYYYSLL